MKYLNIDIDVNALGCGSHYQYKIPVSDLKAEDDYPITVLFPDQFFPYMSPIFARLSDDKTSVVISSKEYPGGLLPLDDEKACWYSPQIGLSYASCVVSVNIIDKDGLSA